MQSQVTITCLRPEPGFFHVAAGGPEQSYRLIHAVPIALVKPIFPGALLSCTTVQAVHLGCHLSWSSLTLLPGRPAVLPIAATIIIHEANPRSSLAAWLRQLGPQRPMQSSLLL